MEVLQEGENKKVPVSVVKQSVNSDVLTEVNKRGVFNATVSVPLSAGTYYTLSTAIAAVPTASKSLGLDLKFSTGANTWVVYRYKGTDLSGWATTTNWEQVPDAAKLTSLETDLNLDEYTIAEAFNLLYRKIISLETIIANGIFKNLQVDNLATVNSFNYNGAPLIVIGSTAPTSAPDFVGQTYVNIAAPGIVYSAKGNASVSDWKQTSN